MKHKSAFCSCRGAFRPPYYIKDDVKTCSVCEKPRLPLPSDPVAMLLCHSDSKDESNEGS